MAFVDFVALKASVSFADAVTKLGLQLKQSGNQWRGACSACNSGGDRALVVTEGKGFYCFSSKKGGDQIALVSHVLGLPVKAAAEWLGGTVPPRNSTSPPQPGRVQVPTGTVPESEGGQQGNRTLQPLSYLQAEHEGTQALGVEKETLELFQAGYAPRGILRGRLAIPLRNSTSTLVAYVGRAIGEEQPKLLFPRDFDPASVIFNGDRIERGDFAYVTDDPLQVLLAHQNGVPNVVAVLTDMTSEVLSVLSVWMDERGVVTIKTF
jgi:DNA primase